MVSPAGSDPNSIIQPDNTNSTVTNSTVTDSSSTGTSPAGTQPNDGRGHVVAEIKNLDDASLPAKVDKFKEAIWKEKFTVGGALSSGTVSLAALAVGFSMIAVANPVAALTVGVIAGFVATVSLPILFVIGVDYILREDIDDTARGPRPDDIDDDTPKKEPPKIGVTPEEEDEIVIQQPADAAPPDVDESEIEIYAPNDNSSEDGSGPPKNRPKLNPIPNRILEDQLREQEKKEAILNSASPSEATISDPLQASHIVISDPSPPFNGEFSPLDLIGDDLYSGLIQENIDYLVKKNKLETLLAAAKGFASAVTGLRDILSFLKFEETDTEDQIEEKIVEAYSKDIKENSIESYLVKQLKEELKQLNGLSPEDLKSALDSILKQLKILKELPSMKDHSFIKYVEEFTKKKLSLLNKA